MVYKAVSQVEADDLHWPYEAQNPGFVLTCPRASYARFGGLRLPIGRMRHEPAFSLRASYAHLVGYAGRGPYEARTAGLSSCFIRSLGERCLPMGRMRHEPDFSSRASYDRSQSASACAAWTTTSSKQTPRTMPHCHTRARKSAATWVSTTSGIAPRAQQRQLQRVIRRHNSDDRASQYRVQRGLVNVSKVRPRPPWMTPM